MLVHFPIALLAASVLFDLLGRWRHRGAFASAAAVNLYAAAVSAPLAAASGVIAWRLQLQGAHLRGALLLHVCTAAVVIPLCWALACYRLWHSSRAGSGLPAAYHAAGGFACVMVAATAHLGGVVSGVVTLSG